MSVIYEPFAQPLPGLMVVRGTGPVRWLAPPANFQ